MGALLSKLGPWLGRAATASVAAKAMGGGKDQAASQVQPVDVISSAQFHLH